MKPVPLYRADVSAQLERIVASETFAGSERSRTLLRFLVAAVLDGRGEGLKEYAVGAEALGKGPSFDPRVDPIVRAEASRLRQRLEQYYAREGRTDSFVITLPKKGYVPAFDVRQPEPRSDGPAVWPWRVGTGVLAVALALAMWAPWRRTAPPPRVRVQLDADLGAPGRVVGSEVGPDVALSPDGRWLVFVALDTEGTAHLFKRRLDNADTTEIPGTAGARVPFFSPDSRWIAFGADGKLKKTLIDGGSPITLCDATGPLGGSWGEDGSIVAVLQSSGPLWTVSSEGRPPVVLASFGPSGLGAWPQILPAGNAVLFTSVSGAGEDNFSIQVMSMTNHQVTTVVPGGLYGRYVADGHLLYVNRGTLFAIGFDAKTLHVLGSPMPLIDDVAYSTIFGYAQYAVSANGTLVYRRSTGHGSAMLARLDRSGNADPLISKPRMYAYPRFSPNGQQLAVSVTEGQRQDLWIADVHRTQFKRWTFADRTYVAPVWSPDGRFLLAGTVTGMYWRLTDDAGELRPLLERGRIDVPWSFSPDGKRLAFCEMNPETGFDVWTVPIDDAGGQLHAGTPEPFLRTKAFEVYPTFSPDGRWLAYGSDASGTWQVYVRAFPDNGKVVQVSMNGGRIPAWLPRDHVLLFRTDEQRLMAVRYRVEASAFIVEAPGLWSPRQLADTGVVANFTIAPDGESVAAVVPALPPGEKAQANSATFVLNFLETSPN
jgi:serine/threonine-protein kinase